MPLIQFNWLTKSHPAPIAEFYYDLVIETYDITFDITYDFRRYHDFLLR